MIIRYLPKSKARLHRLLTLRFKGLACTHPRDARVSVEIQNLEIDGMAIETEPAERCGRCSAWLVPEGQPA